MIRYLYAQAKRFALTGERRLAAENPELMNKAKEIGNAVKNSPEVQELQNHANELIDKGEKDASAVRAFALRMNAFLREKNVKVGNEPAFIPEEMRSNEYLVVLAAQAGLLNQDQVKGAQEVQDKQKTHELLVKSMKEMSSSIVKLGMDQPLADFLANPKDDAARNALVQLINGELADPRKGGLHIDPLIATDTEQFLRFLQTCDWISRTQMQFALKTILKRIEVQVVHEVREMPLDPKEIADWGLKYGEMWKEIRQMMRPLEALHHWRYRDKRNCITGVHYDLRKDNYGRVYTKEIIPWDYTEEYLAVYNCIRPRLEALVKIEEHLHMREGKAGQYIRDSIQMVNWMTLYEESSSFGHEWRSIKPGEVMTSRMDMKTDTKVQIVSTAPMVAPQMVLKDPTIVKDGQPFAQYTEQIAIHPDGTRVQLTQNGAPAVQSQEMPKGPAVPDVQQNVPSQKVRPTEAPRRTVMLKNAVANAPILFTQSYDSLRLNDKTGIRVSEYADDDGPVMNQAQYIALKRANPIQSVGEWGGEMQQAKANEMGVWAAMNTQTGNPDFHFTKPGIYSVNIGGFSTQRIEVGPIDDVQAANQKIAKAEKLLKRAEAALQSETDPTKKRDLEDATKALRQNLDSLRKKKEKLESK